MPIYNNTNIVAANNRNDKRIAVEEAKKIAQIAVRTILESYARKHENSFEKFDTEVALKDARLVATKTLAKYVKNGQLNGKVAQRAIDSITTAMIVHFKGEIEAVISLER